MHPPASHSHPLLGHLFVSLPLSNKTDPIATSILHSLCKHCLCDARSMSQARGRGGLFLKFICNCVSIRACAGMPALCFKKKKKKEKTVSNNVFLLKSGSETSEPLRVVWVMGKCAHARGALGDTVTHNHFSTLNFGYKKLLQPHSPLKLKAPVEIPYLEGHSSSHGQKACLLLSSHLLSNENIRPQTILLSWFKN